MTTPNPRRFIKAAQQPESGATIYVPELDAEEWPRTNLDGVGLYCASFEVPIRGMTRREIAALLLVVLLAVLSVAYALSTFL